MISFTCTVKPEIPLSREPGQIASAKVERQMAIAGAIVKHTLLPSLEE